jgi:hypothetical protein
MSRTLVIAALFACSASAEDPKPKDPKLKGSMKQQAPKIDLGLPSFGAIPSGEGMKKAEEKAPADRPTTTEGAAPYSIVSVQHGKSFLRTPTGAKPSAPFPSVVATGAPLKTEKFSTVVRVKAPDKKSTAIEVVVLDPRGDTVMDASGQLTFKGDEADWTVDWDPTGIRNTGDFQVLVRLGGNPMGAFPLKIEAK